MKKRRLKKSCIYLAGIIFSSVLWGNSEGDSAAEGNGEKQNQYDGVGVRAIPRPERPERRRKARAVFSTKGPLLDYEDENAYSLQKYEKFVNTSDLPFVTRRESRWWRLAEREASRHIKRFAKRIINKQYAAGPSMSNEEYRKWMAQISKIGRRENEPWRFQYDRIDPTIDDRYQFECDDVNLIRVGPFTLTDTGSVDIEADWEKFLELFDDGFDDVILIPNSQPKEKPRELLVGKTVKFRKKLKLRISSSRYVRSLPR